MSEMTSFVRLIYYQAAAFDDIGIQGELLFLTRRHYLSAMLAFTLAIFAINIVTAKERNLSK